ncbi:lysozyme [Thiococcus pfennigii]|jgi:GH24 family phage-related lysozyme (muramidase)|uniref:lysozyme n=1 Tax=Thiococcus pfennigii TaxID=1057 RepID=UPI001902DB5F|nr:lysozyme [Thiococcus pfennigii]
MSWTKMQRLTIAAVLAGGLLAGCDRPAQERFPTTDRLTPGIFLDDEAERAVLPAGVELRPVYQKGIDLTKLSEGFRSHLYNDAAGYCTIAYGHLIKLARCDGTEPAHFLRGVTESEGEQLLVGDMRTAQIAVIIAVKPELTDGQFAALCDFVFNVGSGNFNRSTLLKVINAEEFDKVPFQFRRWIYAGGRELAGLKTRREREIELFFEGLPMPRLPPPVDMDLTPIDIRAGEPI